MFFAKKPPNQETDNKQLFSLDVTSYGAKNFIFYTYEEIYKIIKSSKTPNFYEDNTYAKSIKLFIDYDNKITFTNELERDKCAEKIIETIINQVNSKIKSFFQIENPTIIILMSDTLLKMSLHIVYPDIIFNNICEMKYFMTGFDLIDQSVYKIGCFRMIFCSKMGKQNPLLYYNSINYIKPKKDFNLFLDTCICYTENKPKVTLDVITTPKVYMKIKSLQPLSNNISSRTYTYQNVNFEIINSVLDKLKDHSDKYDECLKIAFCLKDLYLGVDEDDRKTVLDLFDSFSKKSKSYNQDINHKIFFNLEPILDINYLFKLADDPNYILPFYNYREIIFNPNNHSNIIIKNQQYIDTDINQLLKYRYIFMKSPTGTGKTTFLKQIIEKTGIRNVLSITSRVNLAGEHMKSLDLSFYLDMKTPADFETCDKLVIQLESLKKCKYKLYKNSIIVLDEVNSLLSHLRSPTMNNKRRETYLYLIELIKNAAYVISMDCDLSDWNITFIQEIKSENNDYIVYYNTVKNKIGTTATIYKYSQPMIDIMVHQIQTNQYFIACFDSLKQMNLIIEFLAKHGKKDEWLIYSSEIDYQIIDTKTWIDRFVFFTPSIIYGIDYSHKKVDVFSFVYKNHLNPLQIYQMISRARDQGTVHVFCNEKQNHLKYKSVNDVIKETDMFESTLSSLIPFQIDIDDKPYRTMFYNYKFMDSVLKTNIKGYLIDILINKGYDIIYDNTYKTYQINIKPDTIVKKIKERICDLLYLDKDNLNDLERRIVTDDKTLEKHFNLRLLLNNNIDDKLVESITQNLFIESLKNKHIKIKICKELMNLLGIQNLNSLDKSISNKFTKTITNEWLTTNITTIKKTFDIRTVKYEDFNYHNIYLLLITIFKNLFDNNLFIRRTIKKKYIQYIWYEIDTKNLNDHLNLIIKFNNNWNIVDFL